jgi:hypothetical protein
VSEKLEQGREHIHPHPRAVWRHSTPRPCPTDWRNLLGEHKAKVLRYPPWTKDASGSSELSQGFSWLITCPLLTICSAGDGRGCDPVGG